MSIRCRLGAVALVAVTSLGTAVAAVPDPWGLYIGADAGKTDFHLHSGQLNDLVGIARGSSRVDSTDLGYSLVLGFRFTENLAVEASWVDLGTTRYTTATAGDLSISSRGPMLAGIFTVPLSSSWALEGRVGMFFGHSHPRGYLDVLLDIGSDGIEVVALEGAGGADPAGTLGAGLVFSPDRYWSVHFGYEYFADKTIDVRHAGAARTLDTTGSRLVAAVRYRF